MKVALVHDWLTGLRGGEKVLEALAEIFPGAPIYSLLHVPGATSPAIESHPIRTAFTQKLPGVRRLYRWYLPLYPWAVETIDLRGFDLVISSSHCVAKGVMAPPGSLHICYCHTPMRYVWDRFTDYFGDGLAARLLYGPVAHYLRWWDVSSAARVDAFIANSRHVADRIRRYYHREAEAVIPPPVDTEFFVPDEGEPDDYFLIVSALAPYKRLELAIEAFNRRKEPLYVVGSGPEEARLRSRAGPRVRFLGTVSGEELRRLYQRARALLMPGVEDFGIVPLESQACGRPVIAFAAGGGLETVRDGETGVLFSEQTPEALSCAVDKLLTLRFNKHVLRNGALAFSRERFKNAIQTFLTQMLETRRRPPSTKHPSPES
jgi:glycosyltransferase involved in cell wall biosynthesis